MILFGHVTYIFRVAKLKKNSISSPHLSWKMSEHIKLLALWPNLNRWNHDTLLPGCHVQIHAVRVICPDFMSKFQSFSPFDHSSSLTWIINHFFPHLKWFPSNALLSFLLYFLLISSSSILTLASESTFYNLPNKIQLCPIKYTHAPPALWMLLPLSDGKAGGPQLPPVSTKHCHCGVGCREGVTPRFVVDFTHLVAAGGFTFSATQKNQLFRTGLAASLNGCAFPFTWIRSQERNFRIPGGVFPKGLRASENPGSLSTLPVVNGLHCGHPRGLNVYLVCISSTANAVEHLSSCVLIGNQFIFYVTLF